MTGFEPATPTSRTLCATKLRYIPIFAFYHQQNFRFVVCATPLTKTILNRFCSAECYIPIFAFYHQQNFRFVVCATPLIPSPENHKLVPRFDFLPSPTLMTLWARGKGYAECYILRGKYCHHWLQYLPISLYLIIPPTNKNYKIYFYIFVIIKLLFHTFTQKCFDFFAFNFTCCCSWKSLRSYNYIYWSFIRRKLMRELFYFRFHCTFKFFFIFKS